MLHLRLSVDDYKTNLNVGQSLATSGDIFDPNVLHVLHFQLDAIVAGLRTTIKELPNEHTK